MSTLELGVVGNCAIANLVDRRGRPVWHGLARLDDDPVLNALSGGSDPLSGLMDAAVGGARECRDSLASVGRRSEALELFDNVLGRRNPVGLLSEDIDPVTGEPWSNFPQPCSQVGLILSAMRLSRTWEEGLWHAS